MKGLSISVKNTISELYNKYEERLASTLFMYDRWKTNCPHIGLTNAEGESIINHNDGRIVEFGCGDKSLRNVLIELNDRLDDVVHFDSQSGLRFAKFRNALCKEVDLPWILYFIYRNMFVTVTDDENKTPTLEFTDIVDEIPEGKRRNDGGGYGSPWELFCNVIDKTVIILRTSRNYQKEMDKDSYDQMMELENIYDYFVLVYKIFFEKVQLLESIEQTGNRFGLMNLLTSKQHDVVERFRISELTDKMQKGIVYMIDNYTSFFQLYIKASNSRQEGERERYEATLKCLGIKFDNDMQAQYDYKLSKSYNELKNRYDDELRNRSNAMEGFQNFISYMSPELSRLNMMNIANTITQMDNKVRSACNTLMS